MIYIFSQIKNFWIRKTIKAVIFRIIFLTVILSTALNLIVIKTGLLLDGFIKVPYRCGTVLTQYEYPPGVVGNEYSGSSEQCSSFLSFRFWLPSAEKIELRPIFSAD